MSSDVAVVVKDLGKRYRLGAQGSTSISEAIGGVFRRSEIAAETRYVWSLRHVDFKINRGEVVGIIGANGAGKSTLLKLLSRITTPTEGRFELYGRVGSLLEVGTGFHPDLTGRENIFLNGVLLGQSKRATELMFDQIVDFADIGPFLDTPVKRYSSGMYVRLAFAVAAHALPDILIIDEVLAVGDAAFVRKCLGRVSALAESDRTVIFVTHNMGAVERLCTRAMMLDKGEVVIDGRPSEVAAAYFSTFARDSADWSRSVPLSEAAGFNRIVIGADGSYPAVFVTTASRIGARIEFEVVRRTPDLRLAVALLDSYGDPVFASAPSDAGLATPTSPGRYVAEVDFPADVSLMPRTYGLGAWLYSLDRGIDSVDLEFTPHASSGLATTTTEERVGSIAVRCAWSLVPLALREDT